MNEFVVCASAYQPWLDRFPGNTAGGRQYCLNRNNTFWPYSKAFWDYQARCAYMLRQGRPVNDLCVYLGENAPVKILTYRLPSIPKGYDFDACTSDALLRMDSLSYKMLVLPGNRELTLPALRKIVALAEKGAVVYGVPPVQAGSFLTQPERREYNALIKKLWPVSSPEGVCQFGKGCILWGMPLDEALAHIGLEPDITLPTSRKCYFVHRSTTDSDVYFIHNHEDSALVHDFVFRSHRKYAELWNPVTGKRFRLEGVKPVETGTALFLTMQPQESFFIVLTDETHPELPVWPMHERLVKAQRLTGSWKVDFDERRGGPGVVGFKQLTDWTTSTDDRIKYYSGTAVYRLTFKGQKPKAGERAVLQFGKLGSVAQVFLNGRELGTVWCSPYNIEVTDALKTGSNQLEIRVANSLMNRMVGDAALPADKRITFATTPLATPDSPLVPSGIIGDVYIHFIGR